MGRGPVSLLSAKFEVKKDPLLYQGEYVHSGSRENASTAPHRLRRGVEERRAYIRGSREQRTRRVVVFEKTHACEGIGRMVGVARAVAGASKQVLGDVARRKSWQFAVFSADMVQG